MAEDVGGQVTRVLGEMSAGGAAGARASGELLPLVYEELKRLARARLAHVPPGNTLQATALVHEAYLRLVGVGPMDGKKKDERWDGRGHFFGAAAQAMRDILVEQARRKGRLKAGGGRRREEAREDQAQTPVIGGPLEVMGAAEDMLALDEAMRGLEAADARKAKIVMLKFFAGLEHEAIAGIVGVSVPTVDRDLKFAKAWLAREVAQLTKAGETSGGERVGGER